MLETEKLNQRIAKLEEQLGRKLHLRGKTLSRRLRRAGRLLPKHVRRAGAVIVEAQSRSGHPRLACLIDQTGLERAFADFHAYLDGIDPAERRKAAFLGFAGSVVFNLLLVAVLVLVFLRWREVV